MERAEISISRASLCRYRLHSKSERHHQRERGDERSDFAQGTYTESRWLLGDLQSRAAVHSCADGNRTSFVVPARFAAAISRSRPPHVGTAPRPGALPAALKAHSSSAPQPTQCRPAVAALEADQAPA